MRKSRERSEAPKDHYVVQCMVTTTVAHRLRKLNLLPEKGGGLAGASGLYSIASSTAAFRPEDQIIEPSEIIAHCETIDSTEKDAGPKRYFKHLGCGSWG